MENIFVLNYSNFKNAFENPIEFCFLNSVELQNILEKDDSNNNNINFLGIIFTQNEWKWNIMKKINKNIESMLYDDFLNQLMKFLQLQVKDIYFFRGEINSWGKLIKNIENKKVALIYNPKIRLKIKNFKLPIELNPGALLYYKNKFSCFLFSNSSKPGNIFLSEFAFYYYWLTNYLNLKLQDLVIFWKISKEEEILNYSFTLPIIKKLTKNSPNKRISIYQALNIKEPNYESSWLSKVKKLSKKDYSLLTKTTQGITELEINKIVKSCSLLISEIIKKMNQMQLIAESLLKLLPEKFTISEWFKNIDWNKIITLNSLSNNKKENEKFSFFTSNTSAYRKAISFLFPNYSLLSSPIMPITKVLDLSKKFQESKELHRNLSPQSFDYFLSYQFFQKKHSTKIFHNSIFSEEGKEKLKNQILIIEWKIYYDFESYLEILTQTSIQIFQLNNLIIKKDLIFHPEEPSHIFEKNCILELSKPILEIVGDKEIKEEAYENLLKKLSKKVVYIAFNKTFECEWLKKLSNRINSCSKLSLLIKDLTIDLCDWFVFSRNKSLNLITELQGTHSLKRLSTKILKNMKQYSSLEFVQEGRGAQFLFLYYFFIFKYQGFSKELLNDNLSPKYWRKNYKEKLDKIWENIKKHLTEYCSLDVQKMVWAVNWLKQNYEKENLVKRDLITNFIHWIKAKNSTELEILIIDYLKKN